MPGALGSLITLGKDEKLGVYHYDLPLCDVLMDLVERSPDDEESVRLAELAHSFAHDVLNLATLAGRLFWYEGLTPDLSRSPDLVSVSVDAESYFLFLKSACDLLADIVVHGGFEARMRGQLPEGSFEKLRSWIRAQANRTPETLRFLGEEHAWFDELHGIRTNLAHRGYDLIAYTNRVSFSFLTAPLGQGAIRRARQEQGQIVQPKKHTFVPLIPKLQELTRQTLELSTEVANQIMSIQGLEVRSSTHVINGVHVPALHLLESYKSPTVGDPLELTAACLKKCSDFWEATKFGYPEGFWWRFLIIMSGHLGGPPKYFGEFGEGPPNILVDWKTIFVYKDKRLGIVARDMVAMIDIWLKGAKGNLEEFVKDANLDRVVMVSRRAEPAIEGGVQIPFPLVIGADINEVAKKSIEKLL